MMSKRILWRAAMILFIAVCAALAFNGLNPNGLPLSAPWSSR